MKRISTIKRVRVWISALAIVGSVLVLATPGFTQNKIMGEVSFVGATKVEKRAGVWVDGQYLGYLEELKGAKKVLLLPGEHEIAAREIGYKDFTEKIVVEPGQKQAISVTLARDPEAKLPPVTAQIKLSVTPSRAAVFVDDHFVGPVHDFNGLGRGMLLSPGKHRIKIALAGYRTFETEINLLPNQKFRLKTNLVAGSIEQAGPLIKSGGDPREDNNQKE